MERIFLMIIIYAFTSGLIKKGIIYTNVKDKEKMTDIELIKDSLRGKPLTLVIGRNSEGERLAIWMNSRHNYFRPFIEGRVNLQNTITSEEAKQIVIYNKLIDNIDYIQLNYYSNQNSTSVEGEYLYFSDTPLVEGAYWYLTDNDSLAAYIDINTGEYYLYNGRIAEWIDKSDE